MPLHRSREITARSRRRAAEEAQRHRDAEVAFIAACRVAARTSGTTGVAVGDVERRLAEHYLDVVHAAAGQGQQIDRERVLARAQGLMEASLRAYRTSLGEQSSRTLHARERLAVLRTTRMDGVPAQQAQQGAAQLPSDTAPATWDRTDVASAPQQRSREPGASESLPGASERLRDDPQLAALDGDMQRLAAQARAVTRDPAAMQRRSAQALVQRENCVDRACVLRWYAQRRTQLLEEF
jgi:hypothetical protein